MQLFLFSELRFIHKMSFSLYLLRNQRNYLLRHRLIRFIHVINHVHMVLRINYLKLMWKKNTDIPPIY